jgi:o-succinylbenzoate synthase
MRISRIELYRVAMPLIYPFRTAFGNDETIESVLVRLSATTPTAGARLPLGETPLIVPSAPPRSS